MTQKNNTDKRKELSLLMESLQPTNQNLAIIILRSMLFAQNNKEPTDTETSANQELATV